MKFVLFFAFIATLATVALCRNGYWGQRQSGDSIIVQKTVTLYPQKGKVRYEKFKHSPWFSRPTITAIVVNDNFRNNSGANPILLKGGVGQSSIEIQLVGQMSRGINSTIMIYGKK